MRRKQKGQGPKQARNAPDNSRGEADAAPDRFQANVFTWAGPGVENIFIAFEPAKQRKRRGLWKDAVADNHSEASERAESNG
jgi:hypothetical protein